MDRDWITIGKWGAPLAGFIVMVTGFQILWYPQISAPLAGLATWFAVYVQCLRMGNKSLQVLCNPPEELWPMPLPYAWGTVKEVLNREGYESKEIGRRTWENIKEDESRAIITADLRFTEKILNARPATSMEDALADRSEMASRGITLIVRFVPDKATRGTRVSFAYEPHMQKGSDYTVREIIHKMRQKFPERMAINKKELGL